MKKAFTMIELIFVIIIAGIMAAIAIPKLATTRDDANVAKTATSIVTMITDIGSYYTSRGQWPDGIKSTDTAVTDKVVKEITLVPRSIRAGDTECLLIESLNNTQGKANFTIRHKTGLCEQVWRLPGVKQLLGQMQPDLSKEPTKGYIEFGGTGVSF